MVVCNRSVRVVLLLALLLSGWIVAQAQTTKPLGEQDVIKLVGIGIDAQVIATRIEKAGIGFAVDDDVLKRLGESGASDLILDAVRKAAQAKPKPVPATPPVKPVSYEDVRQLLELGIDEDTILNRLSKSPTIFTLDARQEADLKKLGATDTLLAAMKGQRPSSPQAADITDFAVILDCSGSMKELTKEGETKMAVAKRVVTDLIQNIPDGRSLTFVIYGHEVFGGAEDARNCQAVKVVRPLSTLDAAGKAELTKFIAGLEPTGATPIALALRTAGEELAKQNAFCGLILITDGLESCKGDPAGEAAALVAKLKLTFGLHVVGFGVKPEENKALEEIAKAAGDKGKYHPAKSASELTEVIKSIVPPAPPAVVVKPVKPGTFVHDAPLVTPGEYKSEVPLNDAIYYQVAASKGQEVTVVAIVEPKNVAAWNATNYVLGIYDSHLKLAGSQNVYIKEIPAGPATLRVKFTPDNDGIIYVCVARSFVVNTGHYTMETIAKPVAAPCTVKIRIAGDTATPAVRHTVFNVASGTNLDDAGQVPGTGFVAGILGLGQSRFYSLDIKKGDVVEVFTAVQRPASLINATGRFTGATFVVRIHDDDQVEVAKQTVNTPSDNLSDSHAKTTALRWVADADGRARIVVMGGNPADAKTTAAAGTGNYALLIKKNATADDGAFKGAEADNK